MRIRTIKPEFFHHESLFEVEEETSLPIRIAFAGLWCAADREGRFKWEPRRLGVQILPYDNADFSRVLDALVTRGFVRKYESGGGVFGVIPSFMRHQVVNNRERASELPEPLNYIDPDASVTRGARVGHASKEEGKGREGKGREGGGEEHPLPLDFEKPNPEKFNPKRMATHEQVTKFGRAQLPPVSEECCDAFFDRMEAEGWITKDGFPLADWIPRFRTWVRAWYDNAAGKAGSR